MKKGLAAYLMVLVAALVLEYIVELRFSTKLALETNAIVPWAIDAAMYLVFGAAAAFALRSWRLPHRILLLALVAALPHVALQMTHGSDQAYPYIGLFLIVPDLLWVAIGAGVLAVLLRRRQAVQRSH